MKAERTRDLSLLQLRAMEAVNDFDPGIGYSNEPDEKTYVLVRDPDPTSTFYFAVVDVEILPNNGNTNYTIEFKPINLDSADGGRYRIPLVQLHEFYEVWKSYVEEYSRLVPKQAKHDPIFEQYKEDFYNEFEMVDEDADTHPFPSTTQRQIDGYLEVIVKRLESYKEKVQDNSIKEELNEIIEDAVDLQDNQTRQTKNQVARNFASILAKCKKIGFKVLDEIRSEFVKYMVRGLLEDPDRMADSFDKFIGYVS